MTSENPTAVVFRVFRKGGDVLALFPENPADTTGYACDSYQRIGQHGAADYRGCIAITRPATDAESAPLKRELESLGYALRVVRRATPAMHRARGEAARDRHLSACRAAREGGDA